MKRLNYLAAIVAASLTLASCGLGTTTPATTTTNTNTTAATGSILGDVLGQTGGGLLGTVLPSA